MKKDIKEYTLSELEGFILKNSFARFYAGEVFRWIYKKSVEDFSKMTNLSKFVQGFLAEHFYFSHLELLKREISSDKTEKFLFRLGDGATIESVLIPERGRFSLCLSTQVGCRFNCRFCASGQSGFKRNLKVSEIINQYLESKKFFPKITNIVFMGIGEPLDNFSCLIKAINIFTEPKGVYLGKRKLCVSTCGLVPQIEQLIRLSLGVGLSISLHSPFDKIRSQLMPINKKYPLARLIKVAKEFWQKQKEPVTFEYILIKGLNTRKEDVQALKRILKGFGYKINLIPYNYSSPEFRPPLAEEIQRFTEELKKEGLFFTLRKPRGQDILAACGQLRAFWESKR